MQELIRSADQKLPLGRLLAPWVMVRHLAGHWGLIHQFARREVTGRYRGAYLGLLWFLLEPMFSLLLYTIVFGYIFDAKFGHTARETKMDFALGIFCGLILFNFLSECLGRSSTLVVTNPNYVTKVVFPLEVLPVSVTLAALAHLAISVIPLAVGMFIIRGAVPVTFLYLPVILVPLFFLCLAITWITSSLGVFIRDITSLIPVVSHIIMYASAIFYPINKVPKALLPIVQYNPLAVLIEQCRRTVLWGLPLDWGQWTAVLIFSLVAVVVAYAFFMRTKSGFADVM